MFKYKIRKFIICSYKYLSLLVIIFIPISMLITTFIFNNVYVTWTIGFLSGLISFIYWLYVEHCYNTHQKIINKLKNK